jgi:hypothetical protein
MNIVFVAMAYGFGIPVLIPLTFLQLILLYIQERLMTYYFYKKPPMFDDSLTQSALETLKFAAVFYACIGFWMMTNKQLFYN